MTEAEIEETRRQAFYAGYRSLAASFDGSSRWEIEDDECEVYYQEWLKKIA